MIEGLIRPLQTLSNVVSSLREGDYSFRARGAGSRDALGELAAEVNALADLLQKQRVRSLEATALLARILEVMHSPLFAFDRENVLQLVNEAGVQLLGIPHARCFGRTARELGLENLLASPDQSIHSFGSKPNRWLLRKAAFRQDGAPHIRFCSWPTSASRCAKKNRPRGSASSAFSATSSPTRSLPSSPSPAACSPAPIKSRPTKQPCAISAAGWASSRAVPTLCTASCSRIVFSPSCRPRTSSRFPLRR